MRKVTREEFYAAIGNLNVHPQIQAGGYPYTSLWKGLTHYDRDKIYGKTVDVFNNGRNGLTVKEYYLP